MPLISLHDKPTLEQFLRRETLLHLYEIGDLDDFFWPQTIWYGWQEAGTLQQVALLYLDFEMPVLLANAGSNPDAMRTLLQHLVPLLPRRFYSHLTPSLLELLMPHYHAEPHGLYHKMGLTDPQHLDMIPTDQVVAFDPDDQPALEALYAAAYPGNWFAPRMLQTGCYYGIRHNDTIIAVAGVHVYSSAYRVAALGNVTTHPEWRGRGLGTAVCARLCRALLDQGVDRIGLNVKAENQIAIASYTRLGFTKVAEYGEFTFNLKRE